MPDDDLGRFGYTQELLRAMGTYSSFALSFSVISILTGCVTLFSHGLAYGGPLGMALGWPIVSAGTLLVAVAMGGLAGAFPTAGALYHWSHLLGGKGVGWVTAWLNLVGQVAVTAGVDFGCAKFAGALLGLPIGPVFAIIIASHALINHAGVRWVGRLNDFSATVHIAGVFLLAGALLLFGRAQPVAFLASTQNTHVGFYPWFFCVALLQPLWTFTGFDASAHAAEETKDAARRAPIAIVSAVLVSALFGYILLCALLLAIPNGALATLANDDTAPIAIVQAALGAGAGRAAFALVVAAMWFCGLSSITSNSRMIFAFARDGGLPRGLAKVSARFATPAAAIWLAAVAASLLVGGSLAVSETAYVTVTSLSTAALYASYALPIGCGALALQRGAWKKPNAKRAAFIALLACLWLCAAIVLCVLPPNGLVGLTLLVLVLGLALGYIFYARKRFTGPAVTLAALESRNR